MENLNKNENYGGTVTERSDKGFNLLSVRDKMVEVGDFFPQILMVHIADKNNKTNDRSCNEYSINIFIRGC